ncbi:HDOD domain-containing protein [candidate division KSB1 bacterium]|nr:HDOD domain-containing protein [candidate division KSB1 bacterium]
MSQEKLAELLDGISELPTLPTVYIKINRLLQSSQSNASQISRIIESDQAISSKVLRLVNSSFFGFSRKITQINQAVVLLGFNAIRSAVLSISVLESFQSTKNSIFDRQKFWEHSIAVGSIARHLAKELRVGMDEEAFSCGILHDIGKLVLDQVLPEKFKQILETVEQRQCTILEAERLVIETDHCEIGEYLLEHWSLPHMLVESVALHHSPSILRSNPQMVSLVHLADILARKLEIGYGGDPYTHEIHPFALEELDIVPDDLEELIAHIGEKLKESADLLALVH